MLELTLSAESPWSGIPIWCPGCGAPGGYVVEIWTRRDDQGVVRKWEVVVCHAAHPESTHFLSDECVSRSGTCDGKHGLCNYMIPLREITV